MEGFQSSWRWDVASDKYLGLPPLAKSKCGSRVGPTDEEPQGAMATRRENCSWNAVSQSGTAILFPETIEFHRTNHILG